jgi:hypothetical protein
MGAKTKCNGLLGLHVVSAAAEVPVGFTSLQASATLQAVHQHSGAAQLASKATQHDRPCGRPGFVVSGVSPSQIASRAGIQETARWQFWFRGMRTERGGVLINVGGWGRRAGVDWDVRVLPKGQRPWIQQQHGTLQIHTISCG